MLASPVMEMQAEETPLALQRLWNLTRARLAGTSTALVEEPELVDSLPPAQVNSKKRDHDFAFYLSVRKFEA